MLINKLDQMEKIVSSNKSLRWDGWTVVMSYPSDKGRTSKFGAYINRQWHITKRFVPNEKGWDIPEKFVG